MPDRRFDQILWQFFGNTEKPLAATHFRPDVVRSYASMDPEHNQIIEQIRTFADNGLGLAVEGVDNDLNGFLGQFLGHFRSPGLQQLGSARFRRIGSPGDENGAMQACNRIGHG